MAVRLAGNQGNWVLPDGETVFGRSTSCGICILDARLSRRHAVFRVDGVLATVADAGSTNGILVNGRPVSGNATLRHGDLVVIGPCLLTVQIDTASAPSGVLDAQAQEASNAKTAPLTPDPPISSPSRQINPLIAAAINPGDGSTSKRKSETDSLKPSEFREPGTEAVTLRGGFAPDGHISADERAACLAAAHDIAPTVHDEPMPADLRSVLPSEPATRSKRVLAGVLDSLQTTLVSLLIALPVPVLGYAVALRQAKAVLIDGLPRLGIPAPPAEFGELMGSLLQEGGLSRAVTLAGQLQALPERAPFLALYLGVTMGALIFLFVHLLSTVVSTVLKGGPFWHRRFGLVIVDLTTNDPPSWGLAFRRWTLLLVLWPLALPAILRGREGLHDRWSNCAVRKA